MSIRISCLCLFEHEGRYLFQEAIYASSGRIMYRPIGGTIEYGERSIDTVVREVQEEIGAVIEQPSLRYVIENHYQTNRLEIAEINGVQVEELPEHPQYGHDLAFIYEGKLPDQQWYEQEVIEGIEGEATYRAVWKTLEEIEHHPHALLVPNGLLELLLADTTGEHYTSLEHHRVQSPSSMQSV
ncbi:NUDIX domain-containing protein [Paenibacillus sp. WLX2291]|uniref:NUDIX domain-containing protein n=1 Tax=Paenibacillus sp. WLX2291 TaxID=3296934 RepID=UPI0039844AB6